jgi:transcriptional regulator with XRE-family HTH domain
MLTVGPKLRLERDLKGISQAELSRRSGIAQANLSNIENGKQDITVATLLHICVALGVKPSSVLDASVGRPAQPRFSRARLEKIAAAAAGGPLPSSKEDREIALILRKVTLPGGKRNLSSKQAMVRWGDLRRRLSDGEIEALRQRVEDVRQRNADAKTHR